MAISFYSPTTDLVGRMFEDFMAPLAMNGRAGALLRAPDADVMETEDAIRVTVELPGLRAEDLGVDLEGNVLTISGEKRQERTEGRERDTWHLAERRWGRFSRSFLLPGDMEHDRISASFENGVLSVTIPKSEKARRRRIEIAGGAADASRQVSSGSGENA
ncbi:MAG TPA: Hsp20/alpha crystallin family protein [Longimicrobium sp.]|jgi:HSP20 family protein